jgi:hypothetical protein
MALEAISERNGVHSRWRASNRAHLKVETVSRLASLHPCPAARDPRSEAVTKQSSVVVKLNIAKVKFSGLTQHSHLLTQQFD